MAKKTDREEDRNFKPPDSPHFQSAAEKSYETSIKTRFSTLPRTAKTVQKADDAGNFRVYEVSTDRFGGGSPSRARRLGMGTDQVEFCAIQQFPLHGFAGFDADGRRQG
jgi:hypothetical protein